MREWGGIVVGLLVAVVLYQFVFNADRRFAYKVVPSGDQVQFVSGDHRFFFNRSPDGTYWLRVFSYNPVNMCKTCKIGPFVLLSHLMIATPLDINRKIFQEYGSEQKSVEQAGMTQIIARDEAVRRRISGLESSSQGACVRLNGTPLAFDRHYFQGRLIKDNGRMSVSSSFRFDPRVYLLVNDITPVPCR